VDDRYAAERKRMGLSCFVLQAHQKDLILAGLYTTEHSRKHLADLVCMIRCSAAFDDWQDESHLCYSIFAS
jgi:hypothetical protein